MAHLHESSSSDKFTGGSTPADSAVVIPSEVADAHNKWLANAIARDRATKENKILAQRQFGRFQEEEIHIFEGNLQEAREQYEAQLAEQRHADQRQRIAADDLVEAEDRKAALLQLIDKMGALKHRLRVQNAEHDRGRIFRARIASRRRANEIRLRGIEERQKREREELIVTQARVARNAEAIQSMQLRGMDEPTRRRHLREFAISSQQLSMKQQKDAEQLREIQLLKLRHVSEVLSLELQGLTEMEDLCAEQRILEADREAAAKAAVQAEEAALERQQARLRAIQMREDQKTQRNALKSHQRKQGRLMDRQQRLAARAREKAMLARGLALLGVDENDNDGKASDIDPSDCGNGTSYAGSIASRGSECGEVEEVAVEVTAGVVTGIDGEQVHVEDVVAAERRTSLLKGAEEEFKESYAQGRMRIVQLAGHHQAAQAELAAYHKEMRDQKAREHKRKTADLIALHEEEMQTVKTEQVTELAELLATLTHADMVSSQATAFDKQMDTVVSNRLLGNMLPAHVAEALKAGRTPAPASFDNVALFFTDIAGFKELANRSAPRQIVALLNRMYVAFDDVIARFPLLYKVETVMDSFMVCAGLTEGATVKTRAERVRDARVATDCALALLTAVKQLDCSDQLVDRVDLRIGIQCGPVLAGVIGTKMPHYCLFGDTVNVASRMCSTNEPLKLQVSELMADYLKDDYTVTERGTISVKGKGEMKTFWIAGKVDEDRMIEPAP
ncbi:Nitrogen permease regulator 2 [Thoreauomyces humboldtii]|nr:Nitrogen permease regulator 2 [Thoreauomyces humboldtii]